MSTCDQENSLLLPVPGRTASQYYKSLLACLGCDGSLEVRLDAGGGRGKGVFAMQNIKKGDVVLAERPLAAVQQLESKLEVSTCSHCFKAVGTVEQHVGGKICCLINELADATEELPSEDDLRAMQDRIEKIQAAVDSRFLEGLLSGQVQLPLTDKVDMAEPVKCRGGCGEEYCSAACEAEAWDRYHCLLCPVGAAAQPSSSSSSSAASSKGKGKVPAAVHQHSSSCKHSGSSSHGPAGSSSSKSKQPVLQQVHGVTVNRSKLAEFFDHADESNDIFRVAAQVIASTIVTADKLLQRVAADAIENAEAQAAFAQALSAASAGQRTAARVVLAADAAEGAQATAAYVSACDTAAAASGQSTATVLLPAAAIHAGEVAQCKQEVAAAAYTRAASAAHGSSSSSSTKQVAVAPAGSSSCCIAGDGSSSSSSRTQQQYLEVLQAAFLPFALGHKAAWWDVVAEQEGACSDDDSDCEGSRELQAQLRELAADSLALLKAGLQDDRFPQLFDPQLYGSLVGMFELNNLALAVPAPVARYKAMLQHPEDAGVEPAAAAAALHEVASLLDALGDSADTPAEGTGFYALQSCVNHSCAPNAAASCLPNGQMIITALKDISPGGELLISYIEEEEADLQERRAMLKGYGFKCACQRCAAEDLAEQLQQQQIAVV